MSDVDAAKLPVMLSALRLPTIGRIWQEFGARGVNGHRSFRRSGHLKFPRVAAVVLG